MLVIPPEAFVDLVSPMDLNFHPALPLEVRMDLTEAARGAGLPLWQLELLGQDETVAQAFIDAARRGEAQAFMEEAEWDVLEARYQARRRREEGRFWERGQLTPSFPEVLHVSLFAGRLN